MPANVNRDNTFAVVSASSKVVNVVYLSGSPWEQPENTTLVQIYQNESCSVGDTYFPAGSPPTGRFQYVQLALETGYEEILEKPKNRIASGGSDTGFLYVESSLVIGTGNTGAYIQFADGTKMYSAIIDGGVF
jgi:hypothetical protein